MMTSVEEMIGQYVNAWNETSMEAYKREFAKCWAKDAIYSDPFGEYKGVDGLASFATASLKIVPERRFSIFEEPEFHHQYGKYAWQVVSPGKTNVGYDFFEFNEAFEMVSLISFFKLPADFPLELLK